MKEVIKIRSEEHLKAIRKRLSKMNISEAWPKRSVRYCVTILNRDTYSVESSYNTQEVRIISLDDLYDNHVCNLNPRRGLICGSELKQGDIVQLDAGIKIKIL